MSAVHGLGYVVVETPKIDEWKSFGTDVLGMQLVEDTDDRASFRIDERAWRVDVRRAAEERLTLGWEVTGRDALEHLRKRLADGGYEVVDASDELRRQRDVTALCTFTDPDGTPLEIFYGHRRAATPFLSPTGASFHTEGLGLGHVMQLVGDYAEHTRLYVDLLGFRLSDHLDRNGIEAGTFLHCNPRHHSMAFAHLPHLGPMIGHIMLEVEDLDTVGAALDKVLAGAAPLSSSLGKHTNDEMTSFYVETPSGFEVEYGFGGLELDDETWVPSRWGISHFWGHHRTRNIKLPSI